jgi:hypothetical protein
MMPALASTWTRWIHEFAGSHIATGFADRVSGRNAVTEKGEVAFVKMPPPSVPKLLITDGRFNWFYCTLLLSVFSDETIRFSNFAALSWLVLRPLVLDGSMLASSFSRCSAGSNLKRRYICSQQST